MKTKITSAFFLGIVLILSACSSTGSSKNTAQDLAVGFDGLAVSFLKNTPPQKIFEGDTFPVYLSVKNKGAHDVEKGMAILSLGVEKDYTSNIQLLKGSDATLLESPGSAASLEIGGKTPINPGGEEKVIEYNLKAGRIDPQSEQHQSALTANVCYPYATVLSASICMDTDPHSLRPIKKICSLQDLAPSNGQGAPVAVTKIEIRMLPMQDSSQNQIEKLKPQFLIYVEDKGKGVVIRRESLANFCVKNNLNHEDFSIVYVDVSLSSKPLTCQLEKNPGSNEPGHIKLKDKKDIIRCELEEGIDAKSDPYIAPFRIELNYGYTQSISASYLIQKASG